MNGVNYSGTAYPVGSFGANSWLYSGSGDFGINGGPGLLDGYPEMIWRHPTLDYTAVWFLNKNPALTNYLTFLIGNTLPITMPPSWKVVAVGDFCGDLQGSLAWQDDVTGVKVVWRMDHQNYLDTVFTDTTTGPDWRIVAAADFGTWWVAGGVTNISNTLDGYADLVYANYKTGQLAIRFMHCYQHTDPFPVWNTTITPNAMAFGITD